MLSSTLPTKLLPLGGHSYYFWSGMCCKYTLKFLITLWIQSFWQPADHFISYLMLWCCYHHMTPMECCSDAWISIPLQNDTSDPIFHLSSDGTRGHHKQTYGRQVPESGCCLKRKCLSKTLQTILIFLYLGGSEFHFKLMTIVWKIPPIWRLWV